jgi:hypothetical protein
VKVGQTRRSRKRMRLLAGAEPGQAARFRVVTADAVLLRKSLQAEHVVDVVDERVPELAARR